jgi:hypothetical protein
MWWFTHRKSCGVQKKNKPDLQSFEKMRFQVNHYWEKTKTERENSCSQPPSSGVNILRDYDLQSTPAPKIAKKEE